MQSEEQREIVTIFWGGLSGRSLPCGTSDCARGRDKVVLLLRLARKAWIDCSTHGVHRSTLWRRHRPLTDLGSIEWVSTSRWTTIVRRLKVELRIVALAQLAGYLSVTGSHRSDWTIVVITTRCGVWRTTSRIEFCCITWCIWTWNEQRSQLKWIN